MLIRRVRGLVVRKLFVHWHFKAHPWSERPRPVRGASQCKHLRSYAVAEKGSPPELVGEFHDKRPSPARRAEATHASDRHPQLPAEPGQLLESESIDFGDADFPYVVASRV